MLYNFGKNKKTRKNRGGFSLHSYYSKNITPKKKQKQSAKEKKITDSIDIIAKRLGEARLKQYMDENEVDRMEKLKETTEEFEKIKNGARETIREELENREKQRIDEENREIERIAKEKAEIEETRRREEEERRLLAEKQRAEEERRRAEKEEADRKRRAEEEAERKRKEEVEEAERKRKEEAEEAERKRKEEAEEAERKRKEREAEEAERKRKEDELLRAQEERRIEQLRQEEEARKRKEKEEAALKNYRELKTQVQNNISRTPEDIDKVNETYQAFKAAVLSLSQKDKDDYKNEYENTYQEVNKYLLDQLSRLSNTYDEVMNKLIVSDFDNKPTDDLKSALTKIQTDVSNTSLLQTMNKINSIEAVSILPKEFKTMKETLSQKLKEMPRLLNDHMETIKMKIAEKEHKELERKEQEKREAAIQREREEKEAAIQREREEKEAAIQREREEKEAAIQREEQLFQDKQQEFDIIKENIDKKIKEYEDSIGTKIKEYNTNHVILNHHTEFDKILKDIENQLLKVDILSKELLIKIDEPAQNSENVDRYENIKIGMRKMVATMPGFKQQTNEKLSDLQRSFFDGILTEFKEYSTDTLRKQEENFKKVISLVGNNTTETEMDVKKIMRMLKDKLENNEEPIQFMKTLIDSIEIVNTSRLNVDMFIKYYPSSQSSEMIPEIRNLYKKNKKIYETSVELEKEIKAEIEKQKTETMRQLDEIIDKAKEQYPDKLDMTERRLYEMFEKKNTHEMTLKNINNDLERFIIDLKSDLASTKFKINNDDLANIINTVREIKLLNINELLEFREEDFKDETMKEINAKIKNRIYLASEINPIIEKFEFMFKKGSRLDWFNKINENRMKIEELLKQKEDRLKKEFLNMLSTIKRIPYIDFIPTVIDRLKGSIKKDVDKEQVLYNILDIENSLSKSKFGKTDAASQDFIKIVSEIYGKTSYKKASKNMNYTLLGSVISENKASIINYLNNLIKPSPTGGLKTKKHSYTPLNILNGTLEGVPLDVSRAMLPINQLKSTVILDDRSNSNVHRCKNNTIRITKRYRKGGKQTKRKRYGGRKDLTLDDIKVDIDEKDKEIIQQEISKINTQIKSLVNKIQSSTETKLPEVAEKKTSVDAVGSKPLVAEESKDKDDYSEDFEPEELPVKKDSSKRFGYKRSDSRRSIDEDAESKDADSRRSIGEDADSKDVGPVKPGKKVILETLKNMAKQGWAKSTSR
jgi:hypothetical protein